MIRPEDVTDAMVRAWSKSMRNQNCTMGFHDELRAAIAAAINASGCVLVPKEPTQPMCQAGQWKAREWPTFPLRIASIYKAMLAAAPQPGKEKGDE